MTKAEDTEYVEHTLTAVSPYKKGDGYELTFDRGFCWGIDSQYNGHSHGLVPKVGDTVRLYGRGFGYVIRGADLNGQELFYQTPEEQDAENARQHARRQQEQKDEFAQKIPSLNAQYDALPPEFQSRVDRFRANNPDFRWELEAYELFCCTEAVKLAAALKTPEAVTEFKTLSWEQQIKTVPEISDQHSGNTFGCACALAQQYLTAPEFVRELHGALCPLTGCEDYGCVPQKEQDVP